MKKDTSFLKKRPDSYLLNTEGQKKGDSIKVKADVVFGAANKNCRGLGICQVMAKGKTAKFKMKCRLAPVEISLLEQSLRMVFKASNLCTYLKDNLFDSPLFIMEDGFDIPPEIKEPLKLKNTKIEAGIYPLYFANQKYTIVFS